MALEVGAEFPHWDGLGEDLGQEEAAVGACGVVQVETVLPWGEAEVVGAFDHQGVVVGEVADRSVVLVAEAFQGFQGNLVVASFLVEAYLEEACQVEQEGMEGHQVGAALQVHQEQGVVQVLS